MADNKINVTVSANTRKNITVSSAQQSTEITASTDTGRFWAQTSKNWAVSDVIVDNTDYSSKHYAQEAKESAISAGGFETSTREIYDSFFETANNAVSDVQSSRDEALTEVENTRANAIESMNTVKTEAIDSINSTKTTILNDIEFVADGEKQEIEDLIDSGKDELKEAIGDVKVLTTLEIGDIGFTQMAIDESKGKRRVLNGQLIIQDQYVQFTNIIKNSVALNPDLACTEEEWQTAVTMSTNGVCEKYVIDDEAGTIRLPKYPTYLDLTINTSGASAVSQTVSVYGNGKVLGLTNGASGTGAYYTTMGTVSGHSNVWIDKFYSGSTPSVGASFNNENANHTATLGVINDASRSGLTGKVTIPAVAGVKSEKIKGTYFIQVATGAETEDNIINEIELNNPYSLLDVKWSDKLLNNISWLRSEGQANSKAVYNDVYDLILREYNSGTDETEAVGGVSITFRRGSDTNIKVTTDKSAYDSILLATGTAWYYVIDTANESFYLPQSDGFLQFGGNGEFVQAGLPNITGKLDLSGTNSSRLFMSRYGGALSTEDVTGTVGIANASVSNQSLLRAITLDASRSSSIYGNSNTVQPNAVKGYLYFYVGETVQNANLVNIGRIQEQYTTKSMVDGQWVTKFIDVASGRTGVGSYTFDLSNYLPNDGYAYEVMIDIYVNSNATTYYTVGTVASPYNNACLRINTTTVANTGTTQQNTATLPINADRKLYSQVANSAVAGWSHVRLQGYRRIGTNV